MLWLVGKVLSAQVPLVVVLGVGMAFATWTALDKRSAVRQAVNRLVAAEQLAAERAKTTALQKIHEETKRRVTAVQSANRTFADQLAESEEDKRRLADELDEIRQGTDGAGCIVDPAVLGRLRNR